MLSLSRQTAHRPHVPSMRTDGRSVTAVQQQVSLHESTVQRIAADDVPQMRRERRQERRPRTSRPVVTRVHPLAMAAAQKLIDGGTYSRLEIVSATEVLVR